ncbi:hypothetical protein FHG87_020576 [Trinorchestia longiramus]|nr:hypothetical protein FHG87_020576 [Trinorchestia longiramus]
MMKNLDCFNERLLRILFNNKVHIFPQYSKCEHERESLMNVVYEQYGENKWNARCVEVDCGMRYLVGLDEECNMTVVYAMKDFLVHAWNKRQ